MSEHEPLIERVVSELSRPVSVDEAAKARVMEEVRRRQRFDRLPSISRRREWVGRAVRRRLFVVAAAAIVLVLLVGALSWWRGSGGVAEDVAEKMGPRPVQFVLVAKDALRVNLVGDFNDWDQVATPLRQSGSGEVWSVTLRLAPGPYRYAFVVDGERWVADDAAPQAPADDFGVPSSLVVVPEATT